MPRYVAFLRAINVGGHTVKMDRLRALFEELGLANVETFIASGNVLFDSRAKDLAALERKIETHLESALGYAVATFVRAQSELGAVVSAHPFGAIADGHTLSVMFLKETPPGDAAARLSAHQTPTDHFHLAGRELYWHTHGRMSDSKLFGVSFEKILRQQSTSRNIRTVRRLVVNARD
jgi:uncharacterized protein (DUF1697 family)